MRKYLPDNSIDLTITSPPYSNTIRTYENTVEWNDTIWMDTLQELYRVTKEGGVVVWVTGDVFEKGSKTLTPCKQSLYGFDIGFKVHDLMIYQKHNFSSPSTNRYHQIYEFMIVFSKGKPKTFNPIKDRKNVYAGSTCWGKNTKRQPDGSFVERAKKVIKEYGMRYNIWRIKTEMRPLHPAQFPYELAKDHILSWSNEGDTVLDPFAGSGTTLIAARDLNRKYVGFEKVEKYCKIAESRINECEKR